MTLKNEPRNKHKGWMASKRALLATAAFIIMGGIAQANVTKADIEMKGDVLGIASPMSTKQHDFVMNDPKSTLSLLEAWEFLPTDEVRDCAAFAYSVNQHAGWTTEDKTLYNNLINAGWIPQPFNGTTGTANQQVESTSGFIAFRGNHVVIATRGTEMTNWNDWFTNARFSDDFGARRLYSAMGQIPYIGGMFPGDETSKASPAEKVFRSLTEEEFKREVHPGFLQTHLSSWDSIREAILNRAAALSAKEGHTISPQDFQYTLMGHSLGGAKAQLNAVWLAKMLGPENKGNIETLVFGSPRVFSKKGKEYVDKLHKDGRVQITRIENYDQSIAGNPFANDIVTCLPPREAGYEHAGDSIADNKGFMLLKHLMSNISGNATQKADAFRQAKFAARLKTALAHKAAQDMSRKDMSATAAAPAA